jgi:hypothetical protein
VETLAFMDAAFWWRSGFVATQLVFIALALIPLEKWRSFRAAPAPA